MMIKETSSHSKITSLSMIPFKPYRNPSTYKQHQHRTYEEEFDLREKATSKGHIEANNKLAVKDVIFHDNYYTSNNNEDVFQECDEEAFHDEHSQMEKNGDSEGLKSVNPKCPPGGSVSVILYTTSLRGIRKTFDDCHTIKLLLESLKVVYIERDVSMHMEFREELWEILGGNRVIPPRLFIKGGLIGGANEVVMLNECGKLKSLLEGIPLAACNQECKGCGNLRFVVCCSCYGSRKVSHGQGKDGSFTRCFKCNENGLIKCPLCTS